MRGLHVKLHHRMGVVQFVSSQNKTPTLVKKKIGDHFAIFPYYIFKTSGVMLP